MKANKVLAGYRLKERVLEEVKREGKLSSFHKVEFRSLAELLLMSFVWAGTAEGEEFWRAEFRAELDKEGRL